MTKRKILTEDLSDTALDKLISSATERLEEAEGYLKAGVVVSNMRYELEMARAGIKEISWVVKVNIARIKIDSLSSELKTKSRILDNYRAV